MLCKWNAELVCDICGKQANNKDVRRKCTPGLGDRVASGLKAIGITEERVQKVFRKPCGCAKRRKALNKLGERLTRNTRGIDE